MLKISTVDTRSERRLVVEGKLVQPFTDELRKAWLRASQELNGRKIVIDLSSAVLISPEAEDVLFDLMRQGARFSCVGVLTKYVLKRLAHRCHACVKA
jgi:hypothetical protein